MIFVTVGSMFPLDRLIKAIDKLAGNSSSRRFFAQIGAGIYEPANMPFSRFLDHKSFNEYLLQCNLVISHAGIGIMSEALSLRKPLLALPRLAKLGEHVNNHQVATAREFEKLGYIKILSDTQELMNEIDSMSLFSPKLRTPNQSGILRAIADELESITQRRK